MVHRQSLVTFYAPGSLFAEESSFKVSAWDTVEAIAFLPKAYGHPYAFQFSTQLVADPVPDGEGGELKVQPKEVEKSGMFFIDLELRFYDDVPPSILRDNMRCNDWPIVTGNWAQPFNEKDAVVSGDGVILKRGDDPVFVAYRKARIEEFKTHWDNYSKAISPQ